VAAFLSVLLGSRLGMAQTPPQGTVPPGGASRPANPDVVVIDIGYIFRNHTRFKGMMENMKKDLQQSEQEFRQATEQISEMAKELNRWKPGSPEYNEIEEKVTVARGELQTKMALKKKEFMLREARIYHDVYDEIVQTVAYFCDRHGISLVLRYSSEAIEPQNATSVMKGVNRNVVYQRSVNITYDILSMINPPTNPEREEVSRDPRKQFRPSRR
jgi:Skp family chaperone for outer membrane proteins